MVENFLAVFSFLIILAGSLYAVTSRKLLRSVLAFAAAMLFLGGIYMLLNQTFIGLIQIFVYVGGVSVLAAFAYTTGVSAEEVEESYSPFKVEAVIAALLVFGAVLYFGFNFTLPNALNDMVEVSAKEIGGWLVTKRLLEFELISVLLLASLIASISFVSKGRKNG